MGSGFPGLAIVAMIVFFAVLAGAALLILESWNEDEIPLRLEAVPGMKGALGDAVAVSPQRRLAVSSARPAPSGAARLVSGGPAAAAESAPRGRAAISSARTVAASAPNAPAGSSPPVEPEPVPDTPPVPVPVATPVSVPAPTAPPAAPSLPRSDPGGKPSGATSAGGPVPEDGTIPDPIEIPEDQCSYAFSFYAEDVLHEVVFCFEASDDGDGPCLVLLDGEPIDPAWLSESVASAIP